MTRKAEPGDPIATATERLERAQVELAAALADLPNIERADKQMVTARMRRALDEITAAKAGLSALGTHAPDPPVAGEAASESDDTPSQAQ